MSASFVSRTFCERHRVVVGKSVVPSVLQGKPKTGVCLDVAFLQCAVSKTIDGIGACGHGGGRRDANLDNPSPLSRAVLVGLTGCLYHVERLGGVQVEVAVFILACQEYHDILNEMYLCDFDGVKQVNLIPHGLGLSRYG